MRCQALALRSVAGLGRLSLPVSRAARTSHISPRRGMATVAATNSLHELAKTMPPENKAEVRNLSTFALPDTVTGSKGDIELGKALIAAWRRDGILQVSMDARENQVLDDAFKASKSFFALDHASKAKCVDDQSFAGYIASGEEETAGIKDYSEIFTVTKDLPLDDPRVEAAWPCHGPCPWPSETEMRSAMTQYMKSLGSYGERLLQLVALGLGLPSDALTTMTDDGWHHLRVLRFPQVNNTNGKGKRGRGIGSHTDYGLLVIAAQDDVGGLFIRPPYAQESYANWAETSAGKYEDAGGWVYVPPVEGVFTVFPGDMMQYITDSYLPSTPHKVGLNTAERYAFAYFHEPNFKTVLKPLESFVRDDTQALAVNKAAGEDAGVHYGTHFTNMFMRNYADRITAHRMRRESRMDLLSSPELRM